MILKAARQYQPILIFDKIILAWFAKSDFVAYNHVFQVIIKLKYILMKN